MSPEYRPNWFVARHVGFQPLCNHPKYSRPWHTIVCHDRSEGLPPRLSSNLNSRETLSRKFFRRFTPTDSRLHQSGHIRMRHGPGFISSSRNLSCLATICRKLAGRRSVAKQSDVQFRNQSDYPIPGVLSLNESDGCEGTSPGMASQPE